jgi:hypothetical protein
MLRHKTITPLFLNWIVPNSRAAGGAYYSEAKSKWLVPILINIRESDIGAIFVTLEEKNGPETHLNL